MPKIYAAFQHAIGGTRGREIMVGDYIMPKLGDRVLDLGCGSGALLPFLGTVDYVGIDTNEKHIETARSLHGKNGRFICGDFTSIAAETERSFDTVLCIGLLHHLDDERVIEISHLARRYLVPSGRMIALDPVFEAGQNPIARLLAAADAGARVRTAEGYRELVSQALDNVEVHVRHDMMRVPYSHCITTAAAPAA
ncbi:class I SAM-dependent methyltransferase [Bosea sp. NPDC003192]|uniref:class I SAM-dependent methyltransferase n=1 Tax=Bosea sp. NPDC003192 TaxID=3390551 RepID=UPI003D0664AC